MAAHPAGDGMSAAAAGDTQWGEWFVRWCPAQRGGILAWCARTPDLGNNPLEVDFAEEVHFIFGETAEAALAELRAEVLH